MSITIRQRFRLFIRRFGALFLTDLFIWAIAVVAAEILRYAIKVSSVSVSGSALLISILAVPLFIFGGMSGLYRSRYKTGSFDEIRAIFLTSLGVMVVGIVLSFGFPTTFGVPRSSVPIATPIAFSLMGLLRYVLRAVSERRLMPGSGATPVIIFGAGHLGTNTVQRLLIDKSSKMKPVALIDDDPEKRNYRVRGIQVLGTLNDLAKVSRRTGASTVIVCIGFADSTLLSQVSDIAKSAGIRVLVLPPIEQILEDTSAANTYRELSIEDLIGRHPVHLELESIASYLKGSKVLVTGAGGSIGSELCWQIAQFEPAELIALDRDETGLQQTQIRLQGNGLLESHDFVLADIRDFETIEQVFIDRRPDVVFHAAALKHLPMLEKFPDEAWKTNVLGTQNVLDAAAAASVQVFVNISTDKAADPTSVLGHSKRVAEKLTAAVGDETGARYLSVRFGNVIGSRGSMLPTFQALIDAGGPLTVTDPEVTRFFMTIPEACQLVIQAGGIGRAGEVLILDMGEPVRILDVANRMIDQSGKNIKIVFTGLRPGEKLHEELFAGNETASRPFHEKISHAEVKPLSKNILDYQTWLARCSAQG